VGGYAADSEQNLGDERRAANLVLKKLQEQLERGDVDDDLKRQLGVSDEDLSRFAERLQQRLADTGADETPDARDRRRQFEEMLRGLDYSASGDSRAADATPGEAARGAGAVQRSTPAEYLNQERAVRERLSGQSR